MIYRCEYFSDKLYLPITTFNSNIDEKPDLVRAALVLIAGWKVRQPSNTPTRLVRIDKPKGIDQEEVITVIENFGTTEKEEA